MSPKHVIIIGAGYGGLRALEHLLNCQAVRITLINDQAYHYMQTQTYGYIAGRFDLHDVALDIKSFTLGFKKSIDFIQDKVVDINYKAKTVHLKKSDTSMSFDYAIIATGARTNFFSFIQGLKKHSFGVKKLERAFGFKQAFEKLLYDKTSTPFTHDEKVYNIAIAGAGLSGVEIAAELGDVIKVHAKTIGYKAQEIAIHLIDAAPTVLPGMSDFVVRNTTKRLEDLGIHIHTNAFVDRVTHDTIHFKDGNTLSYDSLMFTAGITPNIIPSKQPTQCNKQGQYEVDAFLQVDQNIFALGDCAAIANKKGTLLAPTAQVAEKSAAYVAQAIKRDLKGKHIKAFDGRIDGVFVALGGHYAVGEMYKVIKLKGTLAHIMKMMITKAYYLGLKFRTNTGFARRSVR